MPKIDCLVSRFPGQELTIRRLHLRDPEFRSICDDYQEARQALRHWQTAGVRDDAKATEYRRLSADLEAEIARILRSDWRARQRQDGNP